MTDHHMYTHPLKFTIIEDFTVWTSLRTILLLYIYDIQNNLFPYQKIGRLSNK